MNEVQAIKEIKKIELIKDILKAHSLRNYCLFCLGINSGLRISDLLNLKVSDVYEHGKVKDRVELTEKKTGKFKDFILNTNAKKVIKEYLQTRNPDPQEALFISRASGLAIKRNEAYKIINQAAEKAGITDKIGTHTLRKTFGYHSYKNGVDLSLIQKILQHSSPAITLSYIGITRDDIDSAYLKLNL